ncbi:hypothetical protein [Roseovarius aestuariivivens]|uniref:hypothetical protein n=1 Tax=Roseovarius aestuariivivens TaxID=1888910 RepID=UPI0010808DC7|nr:hypothetical protein [Roseovarius aestuariivivens]
MRFSFTRFSVSFQVLLGLVFLLTGLCALPVQAQSEMSFPARMSDLPDGQIWNMDGDHGGSHSRDMNVVRRSGSQWTSLDENGGSRNEDRLIFGVPLYAPVDGEVVSCWAGHPENPRPGEPHMARCCGEDCTVGCDTDACPDTEECRIMRSGNHVSLRRNNGDVVLIAHLQRDTIPTEICPNRGLFMDDARDRSGIFPAESYLRVCETGETPAADDCVTRRPRIVQGEFLGRAGNSGASSGPHLHIHTQRVRERNGLLQKDGDNIPTRLNYGWLRHRTDESIWKPFRNDAIRNNPVVVHASPFLPLLEASAGGVTGTATQFVSSNRVVTASIADTNSNLKLVSWDLVGVSRFNRRGDIEAGPVKEVYLSEPAPNFILAAVRQTDDKLKMIAYRVGVGGNFTRMDSVEAGRVSALDMATISGLNPRAVTAMRDGNGRLKLIAWDILTGSDGSVSIARLAEAGDDLVSAVSVARAKHFNGVYTAVRDADGELRVTPWTLSDNGQSFTRRAAGTAGEIGSVLDVAPLAGGVAAAMADSEGKLRLIAWSVSAQGDITARRDQAVAGDVSEITLMPVPHGRSNLASVVRGGDDRLYLIGWQIGDDGRRIRRLGSSRVGPASQISADAVAHLRSDGDGGNRDWIATAMRDEAGDLRLIGWDTNLILP